MPNRSAAQKRADKAYEQNRRSSQVLLRLNPRQSLWLSKHQEPGETKQQTIRRLAGIP